MSLILSLQKALENRASFHSDPSTTAYRLFGGEPEGISGLVADRYGQVAILMLYEGTARLTHWDLLQIAEFYGKMLDIQSVYIKRFVADRTSVAADPSHYEPIPFWGSSVPGKILVKENNLNFWIHPYDGFSTGLFLDQRNNRYRLPQDTQGKRVLNCFAYTCGFSVACAAAGANTVNVDISKKALNWGRENFSANAIPLEKHKFVLADAFTFLNRALKRGESYDLVILDPPSFSRSKTGGKFAIEKDAICLLKLAANLTDVGGKIFFSSNFGKWDRKRFIEIARQALPSGQFATVKAAERPRDFLLGAQRPNFALFKKEEVPFP